MKVAPLPARRRSQTAPAGWRPPLADYHRRLGTASWVARAADLELVALDGGEVDEGLGAPLASRGGSWLDRVVEADRERVRAFLQRGVESSLEYRLIHPEGGEWWIRHWLLKPPGLSRHLHGLLQGIGERRRLEGESLEAGERERTRIGQELHDDVCQVLAGLTYMMGVISRRGRERGEALPPEFAELHESLVAAMNRTRAMAHGLFPAQLADCTLRDALEELARQMRMRFEFTLAVRTPARVPPHGGATLTHVFRIAQEAVMNGLQRGEATTGEAVVRVERGEIELVLRDNGRGFPTKTVTPGWGLRTMNRRAQLLGGSLEFGNRSEGGAFVRLLYPFPVPNRRVQQAA